MQTKGITQEQLDAPNEPPIAEHPLGHLDLSQLPLITDSGVTVLLATTPKLHNLNIAKNPGFCAADAKLGALARGMAQGHNSMETMSTPRQDMLVGALEGFLEDLPSS